MVVVLFQVFRFGISGSDYDLTRFDLVYFSLTRFDSVYFSSTQSNSARLGSIRLDSVHMSRPGQLSQRFDMRICINLFAGGGSPGYHVLG
uniref:Uncharacterized protein n=1 Tax=Helianthus annuus TaxID=4232 RepID=A0A251UY99_HELAN